MARDNELSKFPPNPWEQSNLIEALDENDNVLGYLPLRECNRYHLDVFELEPLKKYEYDPYLLYHSRMAYEQGLLNRGQDLNEVQRTLLATVVARETEREQMIREVEFEELMLVNNPEMYKTYREQKQRQEAVDESNQGVEWKSPSSMKEFMNILAEFGDDDEEEDSDEEDDTHIETLLDDKELAELSD